MNIVFENISGNLLMSKVTALKGKGQVVFANYYGLNDTDDCQYYETSKSIFIRKPERDYYRFYIVTTDKNETYCVIGELEKNKYVLNIPCKGDITIQKDFVNNAGFCLLGAYNRYYNNHIINRECEKEEYAEIDDLMDIKDLLYDTFSFYTVHLPLESELKMMIQNKGIVVNRFANGKVGGVVIHTIEGKKAYINAWIDKTGNGLKLMYQTYNIIERQGIKYAYLWINAQNRNVIILHKMMGAKPDGLVDYTFINS